MNKFEAGAYAVGKSLHENDLEGMGAAEMIAFENKQLSSVAESKLSVRYLKKAMCAITAGIMIMSAAPAFAGERRQQLDEEQKIELQIQELEKQKAELKQREDEIQYVERNKELGDYLNYFNIDGLELGNPEVKLKCNCEQFGVYLKGKHLGDIYSPAGSSTFSRQNMIDDISKILNPEAIGFRVNINPDAQKILDSWGGFIDSNSRTINIGNPDKSADDLAFNAEVKQIDIINIGEDMLIITSDDYNGKRLVVTCVNGVVKDVSEIK